MADRPGIQVNMQIDGKEAFNFQKNSCEPVAFVRKWKFNSGVELEADIEVTDPENPTGKIKVVAVMDGPVFWKGGPTDPVEFAGRLSGANRAKLNSCVNSTDGGTDQEIDWIVINHDDVKDEFYKAFHTEEPVKLVFTPNEICEVQGKANKDITEPRNFSFRASFTAKGKAGAQKLYCAENVDLKTVKQFGGVGAAS
jgi:hypothetical protein